MKPYPRRLRALWLGLILVLSPLVPGTAQSFPANGTPVFPAGTPAARGVVRVGLTVSDLDRSIAFYTGVLTFQVESEREVA